MHHITSLCRYCFLYVRGNQITFYHFYRNPENPFMRYNFEVLANYILPDIVAFETIILVENKLFSVTGFF
jgi:hypothetical protein